MSSSEGEEHDRLVDQGSRLGNEEGATALILDETMSLGSEGTSPRTSEGTSEPSFACRDRRLQDYPGQVLTARSTRSVAQSAGDRRSEEEVATEDRPGRLEPRQEKAVTDTSGRNQGRTFTFRPGMACPVRGCPGGRHSFPSWSNLERHYRERHEPMSYYLDCPIEQGHFRSKRRSDLRRHLVKGHPHLAPGFIELALQRTVRSLRRNVSYLDPRGCIPDCYVSNVPQAMSGPGPTSTPRRRMPTVESPPTTEVEVSSATLPTVSSAQSVDPQPRMREPSPAVRAVQARPQREEYLADVNNPETWIPEDPYRLSEFTRWISDFIEQLHEVRAECTRRMIAGHPEEAP